MSTQTIKGFMFMEYDSDWAHGDWEDRWLPRWYAYKASESEKRVFVREMELAFDTPDDFDPIPRAVAALEAEKREAMDKYQREVAAINERLSKLLALTNEVQS